MRDLGGLDRYYENEPKVKPRVTALYNAFISCRRDAKENRPIKLKHLYKAAEVLDYEQDMAVMVMQAADNHYLKLCIEKMKRERLKND